MVKKELTVIIDSSEETVLTLDEICESCQLTFDFIDELVKYDIIQREQENTEEWLFNLYQLRRIKMAQRLQHDLEVNLAGVAVILDLLDELDDVRARLTLLEKHYL